MDDTRAHEIYILKKMGVHVDKLAIRYGLSPEWIRRICEDVEGRVGYKKVEGRRAMITVRDFCDLCAQEGEEIRIFDLTVEAVLFTGCVYEARVGKYADYEVKSFDAVPFTLNIEADGEGLFEPVEQDLVESYRSV